MRDKHSFGSPSRRQLLAGAAGGIGGSFLGRALAQQFPSQPVTITVPLSSGSASDALVRILAPRLSEMWGQPVVVDNKPGANGITGTAAIARAAPNGYSLFTYSSPHIVNASLYAKLPFDPVRDFRPIARVALVPMILCVPNSLPVHDLKDLIALAKSEPGKLNYGSPGSGSPAHLAMEMLKTRAGIDVRHVPYKAVNQAQTDLLAGTLDMLFVVPPVAIPQVQAGSLRALAVMHPTRLPQLPALPTLEESGFKDLDTAAWIGLGGPAGISEAVVDKIGTDVVRVLSMPEVRSAISGIGLVADPMPPAEFGPFVLREQGRWAKVVKDSGAHVD